ncbi:MAG: hypothetical protein Q9174_001804 [Haloplaca sp. 1 TL-2023]
MKADQFQQHFSKQSSITDARLIPHRRIGYVGYKTPEHAMKAVKYHNKSFINMSRIHVELARSIEQENASRPSLHKSRINGSNTSCDQSIPKTNDASLKRKRDTQPAVGADPKLQEYLNVMQPITKSKTWANEDFFGGDEQQKDSLMVEGSAVQNAAEPNGMVEPDYQTIPKSKKSRKLQVSEQDLPTPDAAVSPEVPPEDTEPVFVAESGHTLNADAQATTDDDWLRSRTSRLLGLVDDDDVVPPTHHDKSEEEKPISSEALDSVEKGSGPEAQSAQAQTVGKEAGQPGPEASLPDGGRSDAESGGGRLFVRNLPYHATETDLQQHFEKCGHGHVEEVHLPMDYRSGKSKGFAYIQYSDAEAAIRALHDLDGQPFQGRLLHIIPSAAKKQAGLDEIAISKLPLKKQQQIKRKFEAASSTFNWNSLYINADAVMSSISDRLGVPKSELLDPTSSDAAVKQAHAETHIIQETKSYFTSNGVNLEAFKSKQRGDRAILVKNFAYGTRLDELQKLFEPFGRIRKMLMPPSGTLAIVEFEQMDHARSAFSNLAYRKFKESVLFLEKAPKDLFTMENLTPSGNDRGHELARGVRQSAADLLQNTEPQQFASNATLFVRNLNFSTTSERLREVCKPLDGFLSARVKTKPDPKNAGQLLSMGFGFLEFRSEQHAQAAMAAMDGYNLDNHELLIRTSHKGADAAEERRREDKAKKVAGRRTKIVIKNLPFEASKKDVRSLFGAYGQLRSVRVPKKFDSSTRGFAFAEFVTVREAENAMDALKDTHLLGRRLVLDFALAEDIDPEQEIAKMQRKAGDQADKVALQRLTGSSRKKFNIEGSNDDMEGG